MLHADLAEVSSTDISLRGVSPEFGTTGSGDSALRQCGTLFFSLLTLLGLAIATCLEAAPKPVPREALKYLKVTKGKPCRKGLVFFEGHYIAPPYVVKRYGTALMINDIQVTQPLVSWEAFIRTQNGTVATAPASSETTPVAETQAAATPVAAPVAEPVTESPATSSSSTTEEDPLADLFDDAPKAKTSSAPAPAVVRKSTPKVAKPAVEAAPSALPEGFAFQMNAEARKLLDRLNAQRTEVNRRLAEGGFVFFGTSYPRLSGDPREAQRLLRELPDLLKTYSDPDELGSALRKKGFHYFNDKLVKELAHHRVDYLKLKVRRNEMLEEQKWKKIVEGGKK